MLMGVTGWAGHGRGIMTEQRKDKLTASLLMVALVAVIFAPAIFFVITLGIARESIFFGIGCGITCACAILGLLWE